MSVHTRCTLPLESLSLPVPTTDSPPTKRFTYHVANTGDSHIVGPPNSIVSLWLLAADGHLDFATRAALFEARPHKVSKGRGFLLFCSVSREGL